MDKYKQKILDIETNLNEVNSEIMTSFDSLAEKFVAGENVTLYKDRVDSVS